MLIPRIGSPRAYLENLWKGNEVASFHGYVAAEVWGDQEAHCPLTLECPSPA